MDLTPYIDSVRRQLLAAAAATGTEADAAERLTLALEPAVRLALMDALSQAAAEITVELPAGSVDVRLRGRDPEFVVDVPAAAPVPASRPSTDADEVEDDDRVARITLRISEALKTRIEELAARSGYSLNTWLTFAVRLAAAERSVGFDIDLSASTGSDEQPGTRAGRRARRCRCLKGWV